MYIYVEQTTQNKPLINAQTKLRASPQNFDNHKPHVLHNAIMKTSILTSLMTLAVTVLAHPTPEPESGTPLAPAHTLVRRVNCQTSDFASGGGAVSVPNANQCAQNLINNGDQECVVSGANWTKMCSHFIWGRPASESGTTSSYW